MNILRVVLLISVQLFSYNLAEGIKSILGGVKTVFTKTNDGGIYEYSCEDGDTIDITCSNIDDEGGLRMEYYDAHDTKIVETDEIHRSRLPLSFRMIMRAEYNTSYVDCIYITPLERDNLREYKYKTRFLIKNKSYSNTDFIVTINDMKLTPLPHKINGSDIYQYKFIYGRMLTVTCEKRNKQLPGEILMGIENASDMKAVMVKPNLIKDIEKNDGKYIFSIDTMYIDQGHVQCISGKFGSENYLSAYVNFIYDSERNPVILGISAGDILYEYSKNNNEWVTHYKYSINETLNLSCVTVQEKTLHWLSDEGNKAPPYATNGRHGILERDTMVGYRYINDMFTLNAEHNGTDITCEARKKQSISQRMVVKLHQKPPSDDYSNNDNDKSTLFLIIGSVAAVLLATVTAACVYCWCKKNKNITTIEKPYENFNEDNNPIPSFPRQWNDNEYTYIKNEYNYIANDGVMLENDMYNRSKKEYSIHQKRTTVSSENHYSEIDENIFKNSLNNTTYAEPYDHVNLNRNEVFIDESESCYNSQNKASDKSYVNLKGELCNKTSYYNLQGVDNDSNNANINITQLDNHGYSN